MSCTWIHRMQLEPQYNNSGISRMTPPKPKLQLHSLPPILRILHRNPISNYSKGSRGLSVLPRVTGIFTGITVSPSLSLRQCPNRYAIRAGRVLSDEEFRYLRTVIVTAAVYRSFGSKLRMSEDILTFSLNLTAPGRCQSLYIVLRLSRDLWF